MRSSPRFHQWMHSHKTFGPIISNWEQHRAVSRKVKRRGAVLIVLSFTFSIIVVPHFWLKVGLLIGLVVLITWFVRLPIHESVDHGQENH